MAFFHFSDTLQCGNLQIFLPLRFYVKSILVKSNRQKMSFLAILEARNFEHGEFLQIFMAQIYQKSNSKVSKTVKMTTFGTQTWPNLIPRKIEQQKNS